MDGWTRLYAQATESEHLSDVLDKDAYFLKKTFNLKSLGAKVREELDGR